MAINFSIPQTGNDLKPRIVVFGVGGAGGNAVNNMIASQLEGVDFVVANTDAQALANSLADRRIQLGNEVTGGLGAGARPEIGRAAAEETYEQVVENLRAAHMAFIAAGMGGGTGTGAAPVIARAAKDLGILTVGVVTKPFQFEGSRRQRIADEGIAELQQYVDTLIVIPNQNLFRVANEKTTFTDAFRMADNVLHSGVRGITDLMVMPGLINLDFADVRSVMGEMGKAMMGTGEADGENRALEAAERAIANPLLDDISMKGARGVLINITGGMDLTLYEVDEAANRIRNEVDPEANIIVGSTLDDSLKGRMRVTVVATGIDAQEMERPKSDAVQNTSVVTPFRAPVRPAAPTPTAPTPVSAVTATAATVVAAPPPQPAQIAMAAAPTMPPAAHLVRGATALAAEPVYAAETLPAAQPVAEIAMADLPEPAITPNLVEASEAEPAPIAAPVAPMAAQPTLSAASLDRPDPFREADLVNAGNAAPKPRKFGQMIWNLGKSTQPVQPVAPRQEPQVRQPAATAPAGLVAREVPTVAIERAPTLGLEAGERPAPAPAVDQFLEIPAFLRRQAN